MHWATAGSCEVRKQKVKKKTEEYSILTDAPLSLEYSTCTTVHQSDNMEDPFSPLSYYRLYPPYSLYSILYIRYLFSSVQRQRWAHIRMSPS